MSVSHDDIQRAERAASHLKPRFSEHEAGMFAAAAGLLGIIGYVLAESADLPFVIACPVGMAIPYLIGFIESRREWKRYWKRYDHEFYRNSNDA